MSSQVVPSLMMLSGHLARMACVHFLYRKIAVWLFVIDREWWGDTLWLYKTILSFIQLWPASLDIHGQSCDAGQVVSSFHHPCPFVQVPCSGVLSLLPKWCICSLTCFSMDSWVLPDYSLSGGPLLSLLILTLELSWSLTLGAPSVLFMCPPHFIHCYLMNKGSLRTSPASELGIPVKPWIFF